MPHIFNSSRARARLVLSLAVVLLGFGTSSGSATAAEWTPGVPLTDSLGQESSVFPAIAVAPDGAALAVWKNENANSIVYAQRPPGGSLTGRVVLEDAPTGSTAEAFPAVALNAAGAAVVAWNLYDSATGNDVIRASYRPAGGSFSSPVTISPLDGEAFASDVEIDASGNAVVVWAADTDDEQGKYFAEASVHGSGGGFTAAQRLTGPEDLGVSQHSPQVAMDSAGNAIAVFQSQRLLDPGHSIAPVQSAFLAAGGTKFDKAEDVEFEVGGGQPDVAFSSNGRATVVWTAGGIRSAEATSASAAFGPPKQVSGASEGIPVLPRVAVDGAGTATVIYQAEAGNLRAATRPQGGSFGASTVLSAPGGSAIEAEIAGDAAGNAAVVWTRVVGSTPTVHGSYRPAGGNFTAPVRLSRIGGNPPKEIPASVPDVAMDASGTATAVWSTINFYGVVWASTYGPDPASPTPPPDDKGSGIVTVPPLAPPRPPAVPGTTKPVVDKKPLKCRKGFKKKKVKGRSKCVKAKKGKHRKRISLIKISKCGKGGTNESKPKSCQKAKESLDLLYGQYLGADVAALVGKARSGPNAGREYVQIFSETPMAVTCGDGSTQEIYKSATGWISGKSFSGTESSETSDSSTSGSFTSLTTIKGVYRTVSKRFGVTCETGSRHFTAKYEG